MRSRLEAGGYQISDDAESADVVIVNTCSFIQAATEESIEAILEVAGFESVSSGKAHLVVAGCMPSRYGDELESELHEASGFVPCARESDILAVVDDLFGIERAGTAYAFEQPRVCEGDVSAYVKISDGCDRYCAYCTIPFIRGRYHSFPEQDIFDEVAGLVAAGTREIVLIAQDTGRWGQDFEEPSSLAVLVGHLAEAFSTTWFRILYIQPEGVTDELVEAIAGHDNICSYFDIPFQHASEPILRSMNRRGSGAAHLELVERVRQRIPDATLRTTLIAGYPGETDDQFDELCDFVEQAQLDYVGVFPYSREEGTAAFDLPGQIDEDEKAYRAQQVRDLADSVSSAVIASRIGLTMKVLVCGREEDGQLFGRAVCQAPDVDGVTYLDSGSIGDIVEVVIEDTLLYEMEGSTRQ